MHAQLQFHLSPFSKRLSQYLNLFLGTKLHTHKPLYPPLPPHIRLSSAQHVLSPLNHPIPTPPTPPPKQISVKHQQLPPQFRHLIPDQAFKISVANRQNAEDIRRADKDFPSAIFIILSAILSLHPLKSSHKMSDTG
jgi:hypothetical protein